MMAKVTRGRSLVRDVNRIKLALVGKLPDNDHPYSWSAIINGYDPATLSDCPNVTIRKYLAAQARDNFGIPGVEVSHIWCDDHADALRVAKVSRIPNVVTRPEDVIGAVDAVLIPTDRGEEHLDRARPFIDANVPIFLDKPLTIVEEHLRQFVDWYRSGKPLMSSSALRYAIEFTSARDRIAEVGALRLIVVTACRSWERYGIHAIEAAYPFLSEGWVSLTNTGSAKASIVHAHHASGVDLVAAVVDDMDGALGVMTLYGTEGYVQTQFRDSFNAFKAQLEDFVAYLRTGVPSYPFAETVELARIIIAGMRSRDAGGCPVTLSHTFSELEA